MLRLKLTQLFIFLLLCQLLNGQEWESQWAVQCYQPEKSTWTYLLNVDYEENIYTGTQYCDSIIINDTVFTTESNYGWPNWLVSIHDKFGNHLRSFDIVAPVSYFGYSVFNTFITTDKKLNIYLACEFQKQVEFLDTVVHEGSNCGDWGAPEIFVAKLSGDLEVQWINVISAPNQDVIKDIEVTRTGDVLLVTEHYMNGYEGGVVNFFNQDSVIFNQSLTSLVLIDSAGQLKWQNDYHSSTSGCHVRDVCISENNEINITGYVRDYIYCDGDTLDYPTPGMNIFQTYFMRFLTDGTFSGGEIMDWNNLVVSELEVDGQGNIYLSGLVWDTVVFSGDTIIQHEDSTINIIAKLDANLDPVWYETTGTRSSFGSYYFYIAMEGPKLYFAGRCNRSFDFFGETFNPGYYYQAVIGQVDENGKLQRSKVIESSWGLELRSLYLDNCMNILISGRYRGQTQTMFDTLNSTGIEKWDGIVTKLNIQNPEEFSLGNDTIVCDHVTIGAPDNYAYYYWNGNQSDTNSFEVVHSDIYHMACVTENGCWFKDTINIVVDPMFEIDIGNDTLITLLDTIVLTVSDTLEYRLWSDGSSDNQIYLPGIDMGSGIHTVSVYASHGVCNTADTIQINIQKMVNPDYIIYPNPSRDHIYIFSEEIPKSIVLFDSRGVEVISIEVGDEMGPYKLDISHLSSGFYYCYFLLANKEIVAKVIKL